MPVLTVGEAAKQITADTGVTVLPKSLTNMYYAGALRNDLCPIVGGRRLIPKSYLPEIVIALRRSGKL